MLSRFQALPVAQQLHQQAHADSGCALGRVGLGLLGPGRAGDVKMRPGRCAREFFQEASRRNAAASLAAHIFYVGDIAFNLFIVFGYTWAAARSSPRSAPRLCAGVQSKVRWCP